MSTSAASDAAASSVAADGTASAAPNAKDQLARAAELADDNAMTATKSTAAAGSVDMVVATEAGHLPDACATATDNVAAMVDDGTVPAVSGACAPAYAGSTVQDGDNASMADAVGPQAEADGLANSVDGGHGCADEQQLAIELHLHLADGLKARSGRGIVRITASCHCEADSGMVRSLSQCFEDGHLHLSGSGQQSSVKEPDCWFEALHVPRHGRLLSQMFSCLFRTTPSSRCTQASTPRNLHGVMRYARALLPNRATLHRTSRSRWQRRAKPPWSTAAACWAPGRGCRYRRARRHCTSRCTAGALLLLLPVMAILLRFHSANASV